MLLGGLADLLIPIPFCLHPPKVLALRREIRSRFDKLFTVAPWLQAVYEILGNLDEMVYWLTVCARICSGKKGFAQAYALTGPPSGGKSFLLLGHLRLLGEGTDHYVAPLPTSYFVTAPRGDSESSRPVTNCCMGSKLVVPKESPIKPLVPASLKSILDARDVSVAARANSSGRRDRNNFAITWTIVIQSQGSIESADPADTGFFDKVAELRPPFQFVAEELIEDPTKQKPASRELSDQCDDGMFGGEIFFWSTVFYDLLDSALCKHRVISPEPESVKAHREDSTRDSLPAKVKTWILDKFVHCAPKDASDCKDVLAKLETDFGKVTPSERSAGGLGPVRYQFRAGPKANWFHFFKHALGTGQVQPIRLK